MNCRKDVIVSHAPIVGPIVAAIVAAVVFLAPCLGWAQTPAGKSAQTQPGQTSPRSLAGPATLPYCIVDTGQAKCYDARGEIASPKSGEAFYGQDAQFPRHPMSYTSAPTV